MTDPSTTPFLHQIVESSDEAAAALALEAESPGTEAGSLYYDKCRAALAESRLSFAWANEQIKGAPDVASYQVVGIGTCVR